jgi:hypothetical protein
MLAEPEGRTLPGMTDARRTAESEPADRSMAVVQWTIAIVAAVAAILLTSVR